MNQPSPKPGTTAVSPIVLETLEQASRQHADHAEIWPWLERRLTERIEAGRAKYGTLLETHNGRDALEDAWQEAADLVQYLTQEYLEGGSPKVGMMLSDARSLLLGVSHLLWDREQAAPTIEEMVEQINADNQAAWAAGIPKISIPPIDRWDDWRGASEPE